MLPDELSIHKHIDPAPCGSLSACWPCRCRLSSPHLPSPAPWRVPPPQPADQPARHAAPRSPQHAHNRTLRNARQPRSVPCPSPAFKRRMVSPERMLRTTRRSRRPRLPAPDQVGVPAQLGPHRVSPIGPGGTVHLAVQAPSEGQFLGHVLVAGLWRHACLVLGEQHVNDMPTPAAGCADRRQAGPAVAAGPLR